MIKSVNKPSEHQSLAVGLHSCDGESSPPNDDETSVNEPFASIRQNTHLVTVSEKMSLS